VILRMKGRHHGQWKIWLSRNFKSLPKYEKNYWNCEKLLFIEYTEVSR
jgi:hypothetical protein